MDPVPTLTGRDFVHLHVHSEFSLLDGLGRIGDLVDEAERLGLRLPGPDRSRRPVRRGRLLPGGEGEGDQADHRRRDLRRPPLHARQGGQGRQPALPPRPAREGPRGVPEPGPPADRRPPRGLLLQASHRPRAPGPPRRGPRGPLRLPGWRDPQVAGGGRLGAGPAPGGGVRRHLREGQLLPRAPGPRHPPAGAPQRAAPAPGAGGRAAARRDQRPPLRPPVPGRGPRRPPLRRHGQQPRHAEPDEVRRAPSST